VLLRIRAGLLLVPTRNGAEPGGYRLRDARDADGDRLSALAAASPDGGAVGFTPQDHVPASAATGLHERSIGMLAETPAREIVGFARAGMGHCRIEGRARPYVLLSSLVVHPDHRRRGIGHALSARLLDWAHQAAGPDAVLFGNIQVGNAASAANARAFATWTSPYAVTAPMPMRRRPPARPPVRLSIEAAGPGDLEEIVAGIARFSGRANFSIPWTATSLQHWLQASPFTDPVNHYLVARNRRGRILAGMGLREEGRLRSLRITRLPASIRLVDRALHLLPEDRVMRNLVVDKLWFTSDGFEAARAMVDETRWRWRSRGTNLLTTLDPRGPAFAALPLRPWWPTTRMAVAVRTTTPLDPRRIVEPVL
jgi:GNAT superfamily N-acetyltransferase